MLNTLIDNKSNHQIQKLILSRIHFVLLTIASLSVIGYELLSRAQGFRQNADLAVIILTWLSVAGMAILNMKGFYRIAFNGTLICIYLSVIYLTISEWNSNQDLTDVCYILVPIIISSILFNFRFSLVLSSFMVTAVFLLPLFVPDVTFEEAYAFGTILLVITGVTLISSWQRESLEKSAKTDLQNQGFFFRSIIEKSSDITLILDNKGRYTYVSPSLIKIMGYSAEDISKRPPGSTVCPEDIPRFREELKTLSTSPEKLSRVSGIRLVHADGSFRWFDLLFTSMPDMEGNRQVVINGRDITELKRAEELLKEHIEKYRLLTENTSDVVFICDASLKLKYISPSAEQLLGYSAKELLTMTLDQIMPPEHFQSSLKEMEFYISKANDGNHEIPLLEHEYIRKDGSIFWGELRGRFFQDENGNFMAQGAIRDITERKRAEVEQRRLEEELRQSEKLSLIGQLAGGIAHDFNNHLTAILAYSDLISQNSETPEQQRKYAEIITATSKRSSDLIGKLLAFARKGKVLSVPVSVHGLIEDVITLLQHSIDRRISIRRDFGAPADFVLGDPSQLENSLLNLALNARDAMPDGGEICFSTATVEIDDNLECDLGFTVVPGTYVKISVVDTGTGMDKTIKSRVFEPFFTTKGPGMGTGMGLPAVYGTVKSHSGFISIDSEPGRGTSFHLYFPALKGEKPIEKALSPELVELESCTTKNKRILVVDDESVICSMVKMVLRRLEYDVYTRTDPIEGLDLFRKENGMFDLVILDIVMPKVSGIDLFDRMREINSTVKVIFTSGYALNKDIETAIEKSSGIFLQKPYDTSELSSKVANVFCDQARSFENLPINCQEAT